MFDFSKYLVIFIVGALSDLITNKLVSSIQSPTGGLAGLKYFYTTLPWYMAMFWAGLIFVIVYALSDFVYGFVKRDKYRLSPR